VDHPGKEAQEGLVVAVHEIEAPVGEEPVVGPILWVVDVVLPDVAGSAFKTTVSRRHVPEVPDPF
jgi:hypothetical protein